MGALNAAFAAPASGRALRLGFFVHSFPLLSEAFISGQAAGLLEAGHQVDIFSIWGKAAYSAERFPVVNRAGLMQRTYEPHFPLPYRQRLAHAFELCRTAFSGRAGVLAQSLNALEHGRWAINLRLLHEAAMLDGRGPYDVVHCQFADLAPVVLRLRRIGALSCPIVVHLRGIDITRRVRELGEDVYRRIFAEGDLFLANCEHFRERAIQLGCPPDKVAVFGSAIDMSAFPFRGPRPDAARTQLRLALIGRLVEKKGIPDALRAVALLRGQGVQVELVVLGDGPLRGELESLALELGIRDCVRLPGAGSQNDVCALLQASDLLVAPSVTARDGDEDAPMNSIKEAMAVGLPVVATRHGGIPELVRQGENGLLVNQRDPAAIAEAILWLHRHREVWDAMGLEGRAAVTAAYDMRQQTERLIGFDEQLLRRQASPTLAEPLAPAMESLT